MRELRVFIFLLIMTIYGKSVTAQVVPCNSGDYKGENDVSTKSNNLDSQTDIAILLKDQNRGDYKFTCCGYIATWEYYSKTNTGEIRFQVWREGTGTWNLVGENIHTHTTTTPNTYSFSPAAADRIFVQNNDYMGLHFPGSALVTYHNGHAYHLTNTYNTGDTTFNWGSVAELNNRDYGVKAILEPSATPTIDNLDASLTFDDATSIGTVLFTLAVSDNDTSDTLTTTVTSNTAPALFTFNSGNLQVTTLTALTVGVYTMGLQVSDSCGLTSTGTLTINITNIPPTIHNLPDSYSLSEDHNTELILFTINVTDPSDAVTCSISSSNPAGAPFTVKSDFGIYVQSSPGLDYDVATQYILTIECTDTKDPVYSTFTVNIIENVPPTIHNLPSSANVSEDQVLEMLLYRLNVTDPTNEAITCSVTNPASTPFFMKPVSGTTDYGLYVQYSPNLNYNLVSQYDLTIQCADVRTPVTGLFTVLVLQNEAPVFRNLNNASSVSTLTNGVGDVVFQVSATDNENDQMYFNMTCSQSPCPFTILNSGDVLMTGSLYGTSIASYDLSIYVYDQRTLVGPSTLTISVTDINYSPSFTNLPRPSTVVVNENSALGSSVFQVSAIDSNTNDKLVYIASFTPSTGARYFKLNSATGLLTTSTTNTINYETLPSTTFTVNISVSDGHTYVFETLDITITDVNEGPVFQKSVYSLSGNEDISALVQYQTEVAATDPDTGNSQTYTMDCGTYQAYFTMDSTSGNVTFYPGYDLDTGANPSSVTCNLTVSDGQYTDQAELQISVNQINDNSPQFLGPTYTFYVSVDDGIGTTVGQVNATDNDIGTYGTLSYSLNLSSIACDCFDISNTGVIYVKNSLSSYESGAVLNIIAMAIDGGGLQSTGVVTVVVTPVVTTASTTTTDRYITFWEDPRNSIWVALIFCCLFGLLCLMAYFAYAFGWLDAMFKKCAECVQHRQRRRPRPVKRAPRFVPKSPEPLPIPEPPLDYTNDNGWEPWQTKDFMVSVYN